MAKLRVAIIGQGRSGRDIHGFFFNSDMNTHYEVAAVVEADEFRRNRALEEYPGCEVFADYTELFGRKDIDLVVNASYSKMHYSITKDLLQHGFNVLVEKPIAATYFEAIDLIKTAKDNNVVLAPFMQSNLAPHAKAAFKAVEEGKIGEPLQVSVRYNGFGRRWDWQTLQCEVAGGLFNTGPHPVGIALKFLDYSDDTKVVFSRLGNGLTSGDSDDYAKLILEAPGKPVVDVEVSSHDAYSQYNIKIHGTKGTFQCKLSEYKLIYIDEEASPARPVIRGFLSDENNMPAYCVDAGRVTHEESGEFSGRAAWVEATRDLYEELYYKITEGKPMTVTPEMAAKVVNVMETVHAQNPMPLKFQN